ncbi:sigma-70 family RNA polymerase sigma factor [Ureibacillus xyleni]|uniref:sigma-70 family RNA polymerase sigma factor n=1 Tax=Ureibacillus xyleni TaxID=614648 RepID=UPI000BE26EB6|nr:sigma-70 family RNA polymerase sigma factor [Ureibacillus xyleni]
MELEEIIEKHGEYLYHLSFLYVKDRQLAEEVTQDTLMKYIVHRTNFRGDSSIKTYLTRILINCCHDKLRKRKRKTILNQILFFRKSEPSIEKMYVQKEVYETLKDSVLALPLHYREVIILFYYEEFEVNEIANLLDVSPNTIRTRLRRARELLKTNDSLEDMYDALGGEFYEGI